jgi:hypothetical protein
MVVLTALKADLTEKIRPPAARNGIENSIFVDLSTSLSKHQQNRLKIAFQTAFWVDFQASIRL